MSGPFSSEQLELLKGQIASFKLLASNVPVPAALQQLVLGPEATVPHSVLAKIQQLSTISSTRNQQPEITDAINVIPGLLPVASDSLSLKERRLGLLRTRIATRIQQLEQLPATLSPETKLAAIVELKGLKLAEVQQKLRIQLIRNYLRATALESTADPSTFLRPRRLTQKETRLTERLERQQQRIDRTKSSAGGSAVQPLQSAQKNAPLMQQHREFVATHRSRAIAWQAKVCKAAAAIHSSLEKEEQRRLERLAKDRLKALKSGDEVAYFKLLDKEKDTRLTHILQQTDAYLESMMQRVSEQQSANSFGLTTVIEATESINKQPELLTGGTLKEYQLRGLEWLLSLYNNRLNGILADEMGLGKTVQTIALISYLMEKKLQNGPFLVVVPLSTLSNWCGEFERWSPSILKFEYRGSPAVRRQLQQHLRNSKFNVLLTTYEYIIKDRSFLSRFRWLYLIVDEGHRVKNAQSKLSTALSQHYQSRFRLILTGTPLQNNLPELWSLLNFVLPKIFNSAKTFQDWFNAPFANTGERLELNEEEQLLLIQRLHKVLRPFLLRRLKKDVESELPEKLETLIKCPMSALQSHLYNAVQRSTLSQEAEVTVIKRLNNTIMQLRKICNHPFVFEEVEQVINPSRANNELLWRSCGKFSLLRHLLLKLIATGHRSLIFFQMTSVMTVAEDMLAILGIRYLRLDGSTKAEDRKELLRQFNDPQSEFSIFLLSTRAGGLGLNLQSADTVIIYDSDWNPHQDLQAQDRAHRIGQTKAVRILRLVTISSVEEYILERAQFKLNIDGKVIQAGKFDTKSTAEERESLLRMLLDSEGPGTAGNLEEGAVHTRDKINTIVARSDEELATFRKIDSELDAIDRQLAGGHDRAALLEASELPPVYLADLNQKEKLAAKQREDATYVGKRRSRTVSSYVDEDQDFSDESEEKKFKPEHPIFEDLSQLTGEDGRLLIGPFLELPSRSLYPDYYRIIKDAISVDQLKDLHSDADWSFLKGRLGQMFDNALTYNAPGSQIHQDATTLRSFVMNWSEESLDSDEYQEECDFSDEE